MRIQQIFGIFWALLFLLIIPLLTLYLGIFGLFANWYVWLAIAFVWLNLLILFFVDMFKDNRYEKSKEPYSVIVPVYNENPELLKVSLQSILENEGEKEIVIVDDGSTNVDTKRVLREFAEKNKEIVVFKELETNKGKKFAQIEAIKLAKYDFCVSVDTDTYYERDAFLRLIKPLENKKVGLSNLNVGVWNGDKNIVTKLQKLQMYGAFMLGRRSLGGVGMMNCVSGIGIGFRKSDFLKLKDVYLDKRPFGFDCKFGEDRFMTNLMLKEGFDIVFVENAYAYTTLPDSLIKYIKQQLRWKISGVIEGFHILTFSWRRNLVLFIHSILNLVLPFFCISMIIGFSIHTLITREYINFLGLIFSIVLATMVRDVVIFIERRELFKYVIPFTFLNLFILLWLWVIACFRIDEQSWITR